MLWLFVLNIGDSPYSMCLGIIKDVHLVFIEWLLVSYVRFVGNESGINED